MAHRATPRIPPKRAPRVLYLGMLGEFSLLPLVALLEAGIAVCAVLIPEEAGATTPGIRRIAPVAVPGSTLPLLTSHVAPSVVSLAWQRQIPVWAVARERSADVLAALASFDADALGVACWPRRLPSPLLALPRHGGLNLHPSLLPAHRGPAPLFWTLRAGDPAGVTVHRLDATLDGGDVLAQQVVETSDGMPGDELERRCAVAGGRLLAANVRALVEGAARLVAQNEHQSTYEPWPRPEDFMVTPDRRRIGESPTCSRSVKSVSSSNTPSTTMPLARSASRCARTARTCGSSARLGCCTCWPSGRAGATDCRCPAAPGRPAHARPRRGISLEGLL